MSGCCGQGPVIVSGAAATPRVDVETVLLCDVLPDGTVAGVALTEGIYDTISGARVGTRTVDPATGDPYTPTGTLGPCSPDGCNATTAALVLCDTATDGTATTFVRTTTYDCEGAILGTLDRDLDGAAYTPAGTVGVCPAVPDCESPTTPTATIGLCLPDGTPIAVTVVRDCEGVVTSEGWINLTTGAFSAGAPPVGTVACGDSRSVQVSGTFCDVDGAGEVVGLVLIEYSYAADGAIDSVRLVDAATGDTYVPVGEITTCPAGTAQPEQDIVQLCDVAGDGTSTPFVRDYRRDELGAISGHSDYLLDGTAYVPAGTVGICQEPPCRSSTTLSLCDTSPVDVGDQVTATVTDPTPYFQTGDGVTKLVVLADPQPFFDGSPITVDGPPGGETTADPTHRYTAAVLALPEGTCPPCGDWPDTMTLTVAATVTNNGPAVGQGVTGRFTLLNGTTVLDSNQITATPVGGTGAFSVTADVSRADLLAGTVVIEMDLETKHQGLKAWTAQDFAVTLEFEQTGCGTAFLRTIRRDCATGELVDVLDTDYDGQPYTPVGEVASCATRTPGSCGQADCPTTSVQTTRLCDLDPTVEADEEGRRCAVPFLRHLAYDCDGALLGFHDTGLDGTTPYTPVQVVDCQCTSGAGLTSTIEVPWQVVSVIEDPAGVARQDFIYTVSPENDPSRVGTIRVHVSRAAGAPCGAYNINALTFSNTSAYTLTLDEVAQEMSYLRVDLVDFDTFEPVGINSGMPAPSRLGGTAGWNSAHTRIVPAENDGTGYLYWDNPPAQVGWTVFNTGGGVSCSALSFQGMTVEPGGCCGGSSDATGCGDCDTIALCDVPADGGGTVSFLRHICRDCAGAVTAVTDTALDGTTPYTPTGTVRDCGAVGDCPTSYSTECWSAASAQASYDNTRGNCGGIDPGSMGTCAGNWRISSWIIDGAEQITGAPAQFVANGCGGAAGQFHAEWATALGVLDPSSTWEPAYNGSCLFFIRTSSMDPDRVYGSMTVYRTEAPAQVYTLTPVASRTEVSFTKRFTQECDGTTSVTWLDADGVEIEEPEGDLTFCGATDPTGPDAGVVSTGVRAVTGTAPQDLVAEFAGLQSISLAVLAGTVETTMTDGTAVTIPAGVTLTWSVAKDTDTALAAASFAGADASASYLLNWTYLS
ncbi:hypothetical protein [[Kitasatospora] papulosa]|uniref:hypothetical protein n=1 Tax=[Kitasatospora] papulosa TaxID=1464011 RepID=UPI003688DC83